MLCHTEPAANYCITFRCAYEIAGEKLPLSSIQNRILSSPFDTARISHAERNSSDSKSQKHSMTISNNRSNGSSAVKQIKLGDDAPFQLKNVRSVINAAGTRSEYLLARDKKLAEE